MDQAKNTTTLLIKEALHIHLTNLEHRAERIAAANRAGEKKRKAVVFAAGKYITQDELTPMGITFCQLPYELVGAGPGP